MLGLASFILACATWLEYLARIPKERIPNRPFIHTGLQIAAIGLGIAALVTGQTAVLGLAAIVLGGFFLWLLTQAGMPKNTIAVHVGEPLLPFVAVTDAGEPFDSSELSGSRVMLKFFRGHW